MNFEFTPRLSTFFKRFVNLHLDALESEVKEARLLNNDEYTDKYENEGEYIIKCHSFNDWIFRFTINCEYDEDQDFYLTNECYLQIKLSYKQILIGSTSCDFNPDLYIKQYSMCQCQKKLVAKDGYCENCYPYVITQEDDCCICQENEGVWVKLSCNHLIHQGCWKKTIGNRCPLCRNEEKLSLFDLKII